MGIIHLDVKPANVLLARDGGVRLADFGVASVAPARRRRGTPLFVAPEILNSGLAGRAADAWSYGVVVYLLLVGFPPFFLHERGTRSELEEQVRAARQKQCIARVYLCLRLFGFTFVRHMPGLASSCAHANAYWGCRSSAVTSGFRRHTGVATRRRCMRVRARAACTCA